jgi:hypothetical protein
MWSRVSSLLVLSIVSLIPIGRGSAQVIPVRTVPVASGDQFLLFPSQTLTMGGVTVAVDDSLSDGWSNPAKGRLLSESALFGSPTYYSISQDGGGGRTLPLGGLLTGSSWFGGVSVALQEIENPMAAAGFCCFEGRLGDEFRRNLYAAAFAGRRIGGGSWSAGIGASAAALGAMDGVDLLYSGASRIEQSGSLQDVRVGLYRDDARDRVSILALHSRVTMTHDVTYEWGWWADALVAPLPRSERNQDETRTWGAHFAWDRSLTAPGWRIGASGTMNYKSHPKIPNYSLQNIPRDPGTTWAYEGAFGVSRSDDFTVFALDLALQPIWSETWQEADAVDVSESGGRLAIGDRSIENEFFFTNVTLRTGLSHELGRVGLQAGLDVRSYDYELDQVDHVRRNFRTQHESWIEWSPSFGAVVRFDSMDLRYAGRVTTGTGRPGTAMAWGSRVLAQDFAGGDFVLAPEGPLTLQAARVLTHQLSVRIPVR